MNLYEIDQSIMELVDQDTGEILDVDKLEELQLARNVKIENIACYIKNLEHDAAGYKAQMDAFAERKKAAERTIERLRSLLTRYLAGEKFSSERCAVSFRRSETVHYDSVDKIPAQYLVTSTSVMPDKQAIKRAIKAGDAVEGCWLETNLNAQVK